MKLPVSWIVLLAFSMNVNAQQAEQALPDEALLEFLATFDEKDMDYVDEEMSKQIDTSVADTSGGAHE